jgi:hypothetical protein
MPSEVFWTATMLAGPRRRVAPQCLQYTENMAGLQVWSDATGSVALTWAAWLLCADQSNKPSVPPVVYKNKSSYDHFRL